MHKTITKYAVYHDGAVAGSFSSIRDARGHASLMSRDGSDAEVYLQPVRVIDGIHVSDAAEARLVATYSAGRVVRARRAA